MDVKRDGVSLFFSFSLICIAASVTYFSHSLVRVVEVLPDVMGQAAETAQVIDPLLDEVATLSGLVPEILAEVALLRQQIPPVLEEMAAVRAELPAVLIEVDKIQAHIPPILQEVASVREQIPPIVGEVEAYRLLIPDVLAEVVAEVDATRVMVAPTLDRVEVLIAQASVAGKQASEGAVTGVLTGVFKAPFSMMSGVGTKMFGSSGAGRENLELATAVAAEVIAEGKVGVPKTWSNKKSGTSGTITLLEINDDSDSQCRLLAFQMRKKDKIVEDREERACMNKKGEWALVEPGEG